MAKHFNGRWHFLHLWKAWSKGNGYIYSHFLFFFKFKCIYVMRNPRDVITSGYHFWKMVKIIREPESFEEYSERFLQGNGEFDSKCGLQVECGSFCVSSPGLTVPWFKHPHCNWKLDVAKSVVPPVNNRNLSQCALCSPKFFLNIINI